MARTRYKLHIFLHIQQISWTYMYLGRQKCYGPNEFYQLFDLGVKATGQGQINVMVVRDTPWNGHAPTNQVSLNNFERNYGLDNIHPLFYLWFKGQGQMNIRMVHNLPIFGLMVGILFQNRPSYLFLFFVWTMRSRYTWVVPK